MKILQKKTYLRMIRNSLGVKLFRSLFAEEDEGQVVDLLDDGTRSCAVFVSSVLYLFDLVSTKRATVSGLERDLCASGWVKTERPTAGDVIIWEPREQNEHANAHAGFCLDEEQAVSNDWESGSVILHHITYGTFADGTPVREITAIYTHEFLRGSNEVSQG